MPEPRNPVVHDRQRSKQARARDISRALRFSDLRAVSFLAEGFQFVQQRLKYVHHLQNWLRARHVYACVFE